MHAWAEVEHDLVYKPLQGRLSEDEYSILDELNGLVMAGEIALERLQRAGEQRVSAQGRVFSNHYDLAAYLLDRAAPILRSASAEANLGRVDILYALLKEINLAKSEDLSPYLMSLTSDFEQRPLAEQIIDQLAFDDPNRYRMYEKIRAQLDRNRDVEIQPLQTAMGRFLSLWIELERGIRSLAEGKLPAPRLSFPTGRILEDLKIFNQETLRDVDHLRRFRNNLVHGIEIPSSDDIDDASHRLEALERFPIRLHSLRWRSSWRIPGV